MKEIINIYKKGVQKNLKDIQAILKKVKDDPQLKQIPVFALIAVRQKGNEEEALKLGAEQFIMKTRVLPREILERVLNRVKEI